jgi:repressor LexA
VKDVTQKRQEILDFILNQQELNGYAPSVREIAAAVQLASPASVQYHINELIRAGLITRAAAKPRTLRFTNEHHSRGGDEARSSNVNRTDQTIDVPLLGDVAAGFGTLAEDRLDQETVPLPPRLASGRGPFFILTVRGDSMVDAGIFEGDLLVVEERQTANDGEIVVARINDGTEGTVKVYRTIKGRNFLEARNGSDSRYSQPIEFESPNDAIVGRVVSLLRSYQ